VADPFEGRVHLVQRERRGVGRRRRLTERGEADADLALAQLAGQVGDTDSGLGRLQPTNAGDEMLDLRAAGRAKGDFARSFRDVLQEHSSPDASCRPATPGQPASGEENISRNSRGHGSEVCRPGPKRVPR
jgi:hypothetical protein